MPARRRTPEAVRYLKYETPAPIVAGLLHQAANLRCLLHEAHVTGRLAILPSLRLLPEHNFGVDLDWRWENYFDLPRSALIDANGRRWPLPICAEPPPDAVRTLRVRGRERIPERALDTPLVVRRIPHYLFRKALPLAAWPAAKIDLRASPRAVALARPVVQHLKASGGGGFIAVRVRRGGRVAAGEYPGWMTEPVHIMRCLRERGVRDGASVFVASDERDPDFWRPLQEAYRLFRDIDFPALGALSSRVGTAPPDNYLLYQVELEVLRQGAVRLDTFPTDTTAGHATSWATDGSLVGHRPRKPLEALTLWRWRLRGGAGFGGWHS